MQDNEGAPIRVFSVPLANAKSVARDATAEHIQRQAANMKGIAQL